MSLAVPLPSKWYDGFTKGINFSLPGTGGADCVAFIPDDQKVLETLFALSVSVSFTLFASRRITLAVKPANYEERSVSFLQQGLLVLLCLTFGCEVGYKLSTSSLIWLLNPCHLLTIVQIVLLASPPRRWVTALFRIQMHSMHGAVVALLLPVVNTRLLAFEVVIYWVQHILIVSIPFYLLYKGGPYVVEPLADFCWAILALGILFFIYWIPIQLACIWSHVNLNNMVCPAISDPFYGRYYRLWAMGHCSICIMLWGKLYTFVSLTLLGKRTEERSLSNGFTSNGHVKAQ